MGVLFDGDCLDVLPYLADESIDTVFADPPFNIGKKYGKKVNDSRPEEEYIGWCKNWIDECIRVIKPGGAFFLYNLPRWNIILGAYMAERGPDLPSLGGRRSQGSDAHPGAPLPRPLQPPLLHQGQAQDVPQHSRADPNVPPLRRRGQGLRRAP